MKGTWEEQWLRVNRFFARFEEINGGRVHDRESDYYEDDVYSFFQSCYHLKDWLKNDASVSGAIDNVESYISNSENLCLCVDLCNGSKHLKLRPTSSKASPDTRFGNKQVSLVLTTSLRSGVDELPRISVRYLVESGAKTLDAFEIVTACMRDWRSYLTSNGLVNG